MSSQTTLGVIVLLAVTMASTLADDVLEFNNDNFESKVKQYKMILVEFYAPWCGHCKKLAPEYETAATILKRNSPAIPLAKVDCIEEKALCEKYEVRGFPTLKIFRDGEFSQLYRGPREADGIVEYMKLQTLPGSKEINTVREMQKFIANDSHSIVAFLPKDSNLREVFMKIADSDRDTYRFAHTFDKSIMSKYEHYDEIVVFQPEKLQNKFEDVESSYDGTANRDEIRKFIETNTLGLCAHRTSDNANRFGKPLVVVYYDVDFVNDPVGTSYWRNRVLQVAQHYKNQVTFAISNKDKYDRELDQYGLVDKKSALKPIVACQGANGEKYFMSDEFSSENLKNFVDDILGGGLKQYVKSEPIPESNDDPVKVVVAKNFKEFIDQDKDILIEFYAPWCGHCKKLAPIYDELAEKLKDEDVVIAKMDATANDVTSPHFKVMGFPTLYWARKGKKMEPIRYSEERELDDLLKFIAKEATNELKGYTREGVAKKRVEL